MENPMQHDVVHAIEDLDDGSQSEDILILGTSILAAEKELSEQEDRDMDNPNDGTDHKDATKPTMSSSSMASAQLLLNHGAHLPP